MLALLPAFLGVITTPRTVTVDGPRTIGNVTFDNANSYTIAGPGPLTIDDAGTPTISVLNGSHTISSPMTIAANNTVEKTGPGTLTIGGASDQRRGDGLDRDRRNVESQQRCRHDHHRQCQ